ncbi:MAG: nitroreductase family protein [Chloroflexota bacterium]
MDKATETIYPLIDPIENRYSPRDYDPTRPVEPAKLRSLFEAARWAPSSRNQQPWRFIVATKDDPAAYDKLFSILMEGNQRWAHTAPVLMLTMTERERDGRVNKNARHDLGQAVAYLTIQAESMGLSLRQMGGIYADKARDLYNVPAEYDVLNGIALGYKVSPGDLAAGNAKPREREPLSAFVFSEWETAADFVNES